MGGRDCAVRQRVSFVRSIGRPRHCEGCYLGTEDVCLQFLEAGRAVKSDRLWKLAVWGVAGLSTIGAVYLFIVSVLSYSTLRSMALSAVPPGYEDRFTPELYSRIVFGLRLLAVFVGVLSIALSVFADRVSGLLKEASQSTGALARDLGARAIALKRDRFHFIAVLAVIVAAILLRLVFVNEPIRKDESYTFMYSAIRPIYVGLTYYTVNNHLLNTLLMHISVSIFGASIWAVRLPTLIAGVTLVPVTYAITRLYHGKGAGLIAAALVSGSSPLIEYSFNARGYTLGALFFLLMVLFVGLIERRESGAWILLPIAAALSLYAVPTMLYGVGGVFLYLLLRRFEVQKVLLAGVCTGVLTLVLYAPVVATVGLSAVTSNKWVLPVARNLWASEFTRELISLWIYWNLDLPKFLCVLIGLGIVAGVVLEPRTLRLPPLAIFLCVVVLARVILPLQRVVPFRRNWLFLLPLCFATAAVGLDLVIRKVRYSDFLSATLAFLLAGWMGASVLAGKSLRNSGIEAAGGHSSEAIVLAMKDRLLHGDQFICSDSFDSPLDFEMYIHKIPYRPTANGDLLIVTPAGLSPERTLARAGIPISEVLSIRKIAHYEDQDVYLGLRGPNLPFNPGGSTEMGEFKSGGH